MPKPKQASIGILQVLLQCQRLKFAPSLAEAPVLIHELHNFRVRINPQRAHGSYEHREGKHDDLILAVAVTAWYGEREGWRPPPLFSTGTTYQTISLLTGTVNESL